MRPIIQCAKADTIRAMIVPYQETSTLVLKTTVVQSWLKEHQLATKPKATTTLIGARTRIRPWLKGALVALLTRVQVDLTNKH